MNDTLFPTAAALALAALAPARAAATYADDVALLKQHTTVIELAAGQARVAIAPAWQGRVMTSTAAGPGGESFGWINRELIAAGIKPEAERTVHLAGAPALAAACNGPLPEGVKAAGYQTRNTVRNTGDQAWARETGAPSIWLLGMFNPTPQTTVVIPIRPGDEAQLGPVANTSYAGFGPIPPDRVKTTASTLFFKGDGKSRGKLGIPPRRATGLAGSWQADSGVLTLVRIAPAADQAAAGWPYVDSQWKEDGDPYAGDVINAYNDGPAAPGAKPLGPFYELETSGPAMLLAPEASFTHAQTTVHLTGPRPALDAVARRTLGVGLAAIEAALP